MLRLITCVLSLYAAVLYTTLFKHSAFINISARAVWDVETSLYHSRVHSTGRPTGSVLEATECEADRNYFSLMYCNRGSSQVELLFLGKYTLSPLLPRRTERKTGKNSATVFHRKPLCWLWEMQRELHHQVTIIALSPESLKRAWAKETEGYKIINPWSIPLWTHIYTHTHTDTHSCLPPSFWSHAYPPLCIKVVENFSTALIILITITKNPS